MPLNYLRNNLSLFCLRSQQVFHKMSLQTTRPKSFNLNMVILCVLFCQNNRRIKGEFLGVEETIVWFTFSFVDMVHVLPVFCHTSFGDGTRKKLWVKESNLSKRLCDVIDDRIVLVEHDRLC